MAEGGGEELMSDEIISNKCCVCAKKDKRQEADQYCVECKDYFCTSCVGVHAMIPSTAGHKLLNKADFKSQRHGGSLPSYPTLRCQIHPSKVVDMFCEDHDEVACTSCIALNHRSCKSIDSIPEKIDDLFNRSELKNVTQKIEATKAKMFAFKKSRETKLKEMKVSLNKAVDSVNAFKQELQVMLDKLEQATITELQKEYSRIDSSLTKEITEFQDLTEALNDLASKLKNAEGNMAQEFVCIKTSKKATMKAEERTLVQKQKNEKVMFSADVSINAYLKQIKSLGKVAVTTSLTSNTPSSAQPDSLSRLPAVPKTTLYTVTKKTEVNVKLSNDKVDCEIWGSCVSEDGSLLLADMANKKLKRVDLSRDTVTDYLTFDIEPVTVCHVSKNEAAVSLIMRIQFVFLGDEMTASRTIKFDHHCFGLAHNKGKLFISDGGHSVYIHDMNGKELRKITTDTFGKNIFSKTRNLAVSTEGDKVFVTDLEQGLIILDIQGNYLSTLSESDINVKGCYGVCTDGRNGRNFFVCGVKSQNIVQIGHGNRCLGEIVNVKNQCYSVCFTDKTTRLISTTKNQNTITVMELM